MERLHLLCGNHGLNVVGSWFQRLDIHCWTLASRYGHIKKEMDHILVQRADNVCSRHTECSEVLNAQPTLTITWSLQRLHSFLTDTELSPVV